MSIRVVKHVDCFQCLRLTCVTELRPTLCRTWSMFLSILGSTGYDSWENCWRQPQPDVQHELSIKSCDQNETEIDTGRYNLGFIPDLWQLYMTLSVKLSCYSSTQAEKDERKVRRIMANRESARQTIRRRQVSFNAAAWYLDALRLF